LSAPVLGAPLEGLYDQLIHTAAQHFGLDPTLVKAVIRCESRFDPLAQSPRGAQGLMQLMPATQTLLGVLDPFDPQDNVAGGVRYLAMLRDTFQDNIVLMLAGYNAGPQAVVNAGYSIPPFAETQHYVQCVLNAQEHYNQYGLSRPFPSAPSGRGRVETRGPLVVSPLHFSRRVARQGKLITVHLEARNASPHGAHGVVMLHYPEHLVSFIALHSTAGETAVQLPASPVGQATPAADTSGYHFLRSPWPTWKPGERRRAIIALVPRHPQDIMLHLSVVFEPSTQATKPQRWGSVVRIPFRGGKP
jgi:hypothetical protein